MTDRRKPVPYDAFETDHVVGFVLDADPLAGLLVATRIVEGHGVEMALADRSSIRFGNVHPRLMAACRTKPVAVVALHGSSWSIALPHDGLPDGAGDPDQAGLGRTLAWYFDHCISPQEVSGRPLARFLSTIPRGVAALTLGVDVAGPPFGLCLRSGSVIALPSYSEWTTMDGRLIVDEHALSPPRTAIAVDEAEAIGDAVARAFSADIAPRVGVIASRWRTQLAIRMGG